MMLLLAQVVPQPPTQPGWQFWGMLVSLLITILTAIASWLKAKEAANNSIDALDSARSAESHARATAHNTRHLPIIKEKLDHVMKNLPAPAEELIVQPGRAPQGR